MNDSNRRVAMGPAALPQAAVRDLIPTFVSTRADIDLAEQANIEAAFRWAFGRRRVTTPEKLLTVEFSDRFHGKMFGDVWRWAGRHCSAQTSTDVPAERIVPRLTELFDDARNWHEQGLHQPVERAASIRDRLHTISAYEGGNERHSRLLANLYLHLLGEPPLSADDLPIPTRSLPTKAARQAHRAELKALQLALDAVTVASPKNLESALDRATKRTRK